MTSNKNEQLILQSRSTFIKSSVLPFLAIIGLMVSYVILEIAHKQESGVYLFSSVKIALLAASVPYLVVLYRNIFRRFQAIKGQKISLFRKSIIILISLIPLMLIFFFAYFAITKSKDTEELVKR
jgi:hypothetical protein